MIKISLGGVGGCELAEALRKFGQPSYPYDWLITTQSFILQTLFDQDAFFDFKEEFVYDTTKLLEKHKKAIMLHDFDNFALQKQTVIDRYKRRFDRLNNALKEKQTALFVRVADNLVVPLSPRAYDNIFNREEEDLQLWDDCMQRLNDKYQKHCILLYITDKESDGSLKNVIVRNTDKCAENLYNVITTVEQQLTVIRTLNTPGRFGNQFIRNTFMSMLATKYNLSAIYSHENEHARLGLPLYKGTMYWPANGANAVNAANTPNTVNEISDVDVIGWLKSSEATLPTNMSVRNDNCYFQSRECSDLLHDYLKRHHLQIRAANKFAARYGTNDDIFMHIRLDDAAQWSPGYDYYARALTATLGAQTDTLGVQTDTLGVQTDTLGARARARAAGTILLSSDSPGHPICQRLVADFPNAKILVCDDLVELIQFASTCRHVILSHGSFSALIGNFSFDSTVYYPPYPFQMWFGDMFSNPGWVCVE